MDRAHLESYEIQILQKGKHMQVNFDGMRRNATSNMNTLGKVIEEEILSMDEYDMPLELKQKIIEAFNTAAESVDVMNCLYDPNSQDDMHDLSETIAIELLELPLKDEEDEENE